MSSRQPTTLDASDLELISGGFDAIWAMRPGDVEDSPIECPGPKRERLPAERVLFTTIKRIPRRVIAAR